MVAGEGKGVVDSTIYLRIYGPNLPDLTVLDLPGITRNAQAGQPENIEEIITAMIEQHIKGAAWRALAAAAGRSDWLLPSTPHALPPAPCPAGPMNVLLCTVQSTVDFSNEAAIKLARKHDPDRTRTMARRCWHSLPGGLLPLLRRTLLCCPCSLHAAVLLPVLLPWPGCAAHCRAAATPVPLHTGHLPHTCCCPAVHSRPINPSSCLPAHASAVRGDQD